MSKIKINKTIKTLIKIKEWISIQKIIIIIISSITIKIKILIGVIALIKEVSHMSKIKINKTIKTLIKETKRILTQEVVQENITIKILIKYKHKINLVIFNNILLTTRISINNKFQTKNNQMGMGTIINQMEMGIIITSNLWKNWNHKSLKVYINPIDIICIKN